MVKRHPSRGRARFSVRTVYDIVLDRLRHHGPGAAAGGLLASLVVLILGVGLGYPLVFGDYALLTAAKLRAYGTYAPVVGTPWLSDASFGGWSRWVGIDSTGHRLLNLGLHGVAVALVFAIARRLQGRADAAGMHRGWVAWLAAALFALHPAVVYTEAYLAARPLLLQGSWGLLALWSTLRAADQDRRGLWWLPPVACVGALLSSPAAIGLPLALMFVAATLDPSRRRAPLWSAVAIAMLAAVAYLVWWGMLGTSALAAESYFASVGDNAWRWLRGLGYAVVPVVGWMAIDMPEPTPVASLWQAGAGVVVYVVLIAASLRLLLRPSLRALGAAGLLLATLASAEIFFPGAWAGFAPWRSYPWIAFVAMGAAFCVGHLRPPLALATGIGLLAVVSVLGLLTLQTFSSHVGVWDHAIRAAEGFGPLAKDARLYVNRATLHRAQGHTIAAVADYDRALALQPDFPRALRGRAQANIDSRRYAAALEDLQRLLAVEPANAGTYADIGLVHMQLGRHGEAMKAFNTAIEKGVQEPRLYLNRGLTLFQIGGLGAAPRALDDIERALKLDPDYALAHFNRGRIFEQAAQAGMRLRDAVSPQIMRIVANQNIARACQLGHRPACELERERAADPPKVEERGDSPMRLTPEMLRERGLLPSR